MSDETIDVDAIVADIHSARAEADSETPLPAVEDVKRDADLYACLARANQSCGEVGLLGGLRGLVQRLMRKLLGPELTAMRQHDQDVVRTLNKVVKVLDGSNDDLNGAILASSRTRLDILQALAQRVESLEQEVASLRGTAETETRS